MAHSYHSGLSLKVLFSRTAVSNLFGTRDRFRGRQFFHGRGRVGGMVEVVMRAMGSGRGSFTRCLPLTSCCVARFLTGHGLLPVRCPGVGDPSSRRYSLTTLYKVEYLLVFCIFTMFSFITLAKILNHSFCLFTSFSIPCSPLYTSEYNP